MKKSDVLNVLVLALVASLAFGTPLAAQDLEQELYEELARSVGEGLSSGVATKRAMAPAPLRVQKMTGTQSCLPTCSTVDGRFLFVTPSAVLDTLADDDLEFELGLPAGTTSFSFGLFDGDIGGTSPTVDGLSTSPHWDLGTADLQLTLIADPAADGTGTQVVQTWSNVAAPDNDWIDFQVATGPEAMAPSGNYFYRLEVTMTNASFNALNAFKLRTNGVVTVEVFQQPIGFVAQITSLDDARTIYPAFPSLTPTNYDGTLDFFLDFAQSQDEFSLWGGDMDHGDFTGLVTRDTDDPDTPNNVLPPWAGPGAALEGVAVGNGASTGAPADDRNPAGLGAYLLKAPSVVWELRIPDGTVLFNDNPSGNREWEQFRVTTFPAGPTEADFNVSALPPGTYSLSLEGLDMQNLNTFYFFRPVVCVQDSGEVCDPLEPFGLGDTVFEDLDGDGVQGAGEGGLAGVEVEVYDAGGFLVGTATTDADGNYFVGLENGTYTVRLADSNFAAGGALFGYVETTGGELTGTIDGDVDLTVDFGVRSLGSIGDLVWVDTNADGAYDAGIDHGVGGVTLLLTEAGPDGVFGTADDVDAGSTITAADGSYTFENLGPGTYRVDVDDSTVPADYVLFAGNDPTTVTLGPGEMNDDVDFGYQGTGSIGDTVFFDRDRDGMFDAGTEQGIGGVTVTLTEAGPDGVFDTADDIDMGSTVTDANGVYTFGNLVAGDYRVDVQDDTVPSNFVKLTGADDPAFVTLGPAEMNDTVDFGYFDPAFADGTGTIGYWKNHASAWPVDSLILGAEVYTQQEAIDLLRTPTRGDASIQLGKQLVAAKLNVASGNYSFCVDDAIAEADALLADTPVGTLSKKDKDTKNAMNAIKDILDDYNNGRLCAPHRG